MKVLLSTEALLEAAQERAGLTREQLLLMVAKSGLVRHLATGPDAKRFVLKGGTLLHHVYRSPRQSIRDADYTEIFFMPLEHTLSPDQTLIDVANVERYAGEFWMPSLEQLAATPR